MFVQHMELALPCRHHLLEVSITVELEPKTSYLEHDHSEDLVNKVVDR